MNIIKSKLFKIIMFNFIFGIILGIIIFIISDKEDLNEFINNMNNYFSLIENNSFNYTNGLFKSIISNIKINSIIFLSGITLIFSFIIPFIIIFRGFLNGFLISGLVYCFNIKGFLYALILLFPHKLINEFIYLLMSYYAINISVKTINSIKKNKSINFKIFYKNYIYIYLIFILVLIISSIIEIYISSFLLKFIV